MDFSRFLQDPWWELFGITGQLVFGVRFVYQWLVSERAKKSVVPDGFWWLSIVGSLMILTYAVHKASLAFIIPPMLGLPIYIRNVFLIRSHRRDLGAA